MIAIILWSQAVTHSIRVMALEASPGGVIRITVLSMEEVN